MIKGGTIKGDTIVGGITIMGDTIVEDITIMIVIVVETTVVVVVAAEGVPQSAALCLGLASARWWAARSRRLNRPIMHRPLCTMPLRNKATTRRHPQCITATDGSAGESSTELVTMTIKSTCYSATLAAAMLLPALALPVGAFAQTQAPAAGTAPAAKAKAPAHKHVSAEERVEQHITQLHAQLRITPAQQPQWDQFAQVMRDNAKNMDQVLEQRAAGFATMDAAEDMQSYAQVAQQHAQDTQKLATTFQTLYGSLSDEQKKNADAVFHARGDRAGHKKR
jgi:periplasmic protein CpxP/Spy